MKLKLTLIVLFGLLLLSFQRDEGKGENLFPTYTQVLHLTYEITSEDAQRYITADEGFDKEFPNWVFEALPQTLDKKLSKKMVKAGCSKTNIETSKFAVLNEIFSSSEGEKFPSTSCKPVYRDFLIFKNKKNVVGIAQICFTCSQIEFVGVDVSTDHFGHNGEYQKLKALLYNE